MPKNNLQHNGKFLAYIRVSSKDQEQGMSLEVQQHQIETYTREKEIQIDQFFGGVESASATGREEFGELVSILKKEKYQGVIFHKIDRSGRNPADQGKLYELMEEGYEFHFVYERYSTKDGTGRIMLYMMWAMASAYSENLKAEIQKGIFGLLKNGRYPNPAPVGYKDANHGVKLIDEKLAPLVKKAFELYSTNNYDVKTLHKRLSDLGMTNKKGKPLNTQTLYKMFRNSFYYGCIEYNGESYVGAHEPIISKELFDRVQEVMNKKSYKHKRKFVYLFAGLVSCRVCGKPLRSISAKNRYKYYSCRNLDCKCNLKEETVESQFFSGLRKLEFEDKEVEAFLEAVKVFRQELRQTKGAELKHIALELEKIKSDSDHLLDLYLGKKIDDLEHKTVKTKLTNKELELRERQAALMNADNKIIDQIAEIGKLLKRPSMVYRIASDEKKVLLVKSLVENFSWQEGELQIRWKNQYKIVAERNKNTTENGDAFVGSPNP